VDNFFKNIHAYNLKFERAIIKILILRIIIVLAKIKNRRNIGSNVCYTWTIFKNDPSL